MRSPIKPCAFAFLIIVFQPLFVNGIVYGSYQQTEAEAHADKASQFAQAGDLADAEVELRRAVQLAPDSPGFLANLGTVLAMQRKLDDSTKVFERALKLDPSDLTVRRYLAANLWQVHRYGEAKQNLELILKEKPDDEPTRLLLGMVSENMKDYATAVRMLASVPAQVQERPESMAALARSYYHPRCERESTGHTPRAADPSGGPKGILLGSQIADEMRDYDTAEKLLASIKPDTSNQAVGARDKVVLRRSATMTHKGDHLGIPASGKLIRITGMTMVRIRNGQIVEGWNNWDQLAMMQQIGAYGQPEAVLLKKTG